MGESSDTPLKLQFDRRVRLDFRGATITSDGWTVIDGTGKTCASILAALTEQVTNDPGSFVEVIMPDVLNTYDVIVWAEKGGHNILTQRKSPDGSSRLLVQP